VCDVLRSSAPGEKLKVSGVFTAAGKDVNGVPVNVGDPWEVNMALKN
jgi:hypothetical protein